MLYLLEDESFTPADYGARAALLARSLGATLLHLPAGFDVRRYPDAVQHVTHDGALVPSGLVWAERLAGIPVSAAVDAEAVMSRAAERDIVVPLHPGVEGGLASAETLLALARRRDVATRHYRAVHDAAGCRIIDVADGHPVRDIGPCAQDRFGRWMILTHASAGSTPAVSTQMPAGALSGVARCRIALIGGEVDQRDVYPATLAALGDAADALGIHVEVEFIAPQTLNDANVRATLSGFEGIVLPGGSDMTRVSGQIAAARHALVLGTPAVGLCLGMQTMATAAAQLALGSSDVGLVEVDPDIRLQSFIPIAGAGAAPDLHRLGGRDAGVVAGSQLEAILGGVTRLRYNHRYRLNASLYPVLDTVKVDVCAWDADGLIADAIEARAHPFYIGMQGHPELTSAAGRPHPLLTAFLRAACTASRS
jgi:CTP synthase